jgi:peptidoglycan hydrolase-like protein with peptidoglycan-binding domain
MSYIITRDQWGARFPAGFGPRPARGLRAYEHHSVTIAPDLVAPFDDDYAAIRRIEEIGQERFGHGFSYQHAITPVGLVFEGCGIGRVGSAIAGYNTPSWNIVLVGNYQHKAPPKAMLQALTWLLHHGADQGWIDAPRLTGGHRDAPGAATACPGAKAHALIDDVNAGRYAGAVKPSPQEEYDMDRIDLRQAHEKAVRGHHMDQLQALLLAAGYGPTGLVARNGRPDGIGGKYTRAALGAFQVRTNTGTDKKPDYVAGPKTWAALLE